MNSQAFPGFDKAHSKRNASCSTAIAKNGKPAKKRIKNVQHRNGILDSYLFRTQGIHTPGQKKGQNRKENRLCFFSTNMFTLTICLWLFKRI